MYLTTHLIAFHTQAIKPFPSVFSYAISLSSAGLLSYITCIGLKSIKNKFINPIIKPLSILSLGITYYGFAMIEYSAIYHLAKKIFLK